MATNHNSRALIVGLGKSGFAAAKLLALQNIEVTIFDAKLEECFPKEDVDLLKRQGVYFFFQKEPEDLCFETVVMSPGISPLMPMIQKAKAAGAEVIGELELAYRNCKGSFIAITGTNGKTTTTALVGEMFSLANLPFELVGNIGLPVTLRSVHATNETTMVTEVSSFQLETIIDFHPKVSAILNVTPDHLDRHACMQEYTRVKSRIFENQKAGDYFIYNADDPLCVEASLKCKEAKCIPFSRLKQLAYGAFVDCDRVVIKTGDINESEIYFCDISQILIPGTHNLENALAAVAIAYFSGVLKD